MTPNFAHPGTGARGGAVASSPLAADRPEMPPVICAQCQRGDCFAARHDYEPDCRCPDARHDPGAGDDQLNAEQFFARGRYDTETGPSYFAERDETDRAEQLFPAPLPMERELWRAV